MLRSFFLIATTACVAQQSAQPGPSFGGDLSFLEAEARLNAGYLPDPELLTEAGLLSGSPIAIGQQPCEERVCLATRSVWTEDGLLVGIGIDGVPVRPPVHLAFALDASGSMEGSEDVRAATVEIALDALDTADQLSVWAFTSEVVELVPMGTVDPTQTRNALAALDHLSAFRDVLREVEGDSFEAILARLLETEASESNGDTGDTGDTGLADDLDGPIDLMLELIELTEDTPWVEDGLFRLAESSGSAVAEAAETVLASLPDGTEARASRMALVSDFDGSSALGVVEEAAERHVGTSVLGLTADADSTKMRDLATAPGAHTFEAAEPSAALAQWEERFDAVVAPNAWGLSVALDPASEADWTLVRQFGGTTDEGVQAYFASNSHAVLAAVLQPRTPEPAQPLFQVTVTTAEEDLTAATWSRVPLRLVETPWGVGDDEVALDLAWRVALFDAVSNGDAAALDLWEARPDAP
jgi:hypothetical protein